MLKTIVRLLTALLLVTVLAIGGLYFYNYDRTYFNKDSEIIGNTSGNIYNGGVFCEREGKIYFSNDYSNQSLYAMNSDLSGIKQLSVDKAVYINADENYIYYVRANSPKENIKNALMVFNNNGVYRINRDGTNLKAISDNPGGYLMLKGNNIYFQSYDANQGSNVYRYQIDGKNERLLVEGSVIPSAVISDYLYYAGSSPDHKLHRMSLNSYTSHPIFKGAYLYPVITENYIYYMDISDNNKIYRMNLDGSERTKLVNTRCSTYNITNSGMYLYYQVDNSKSNGIYRLNLTTMETNKVQDGDYKQINVTDKYVFFKDFDNKNTYYIAADGANIVAAFDTLLSTK